MHSPADLADALELGIRRAQQQRAQAEPAGSLEGLSDDALHALAAESLAATAPWSARAVPYPGFEPPRASRKARAPRCAVVVAGSPLDEPSTGLDLYSDHRATAESACWIEITVAREWRSLARCPDYHRAFATRSLRWAAQLATDERVLHGRLAWVILASTAQRALADLHAWERLAVAEGLPVGAAVSRTTVLPDLEGNAACVTAIVPVHRL